MATIRKTVSGLKPDSNYLFAVKPKNTEISASDTIPDSIRIKTPSSSSVPSGITGFEVRCNFESVMFIIQPVADQDFAEYEYEIYDGETISSTLVSTGKKRSTVFVISVANTTRNVNPTTGAETVAYKKYYGRVRAINTSGTGGAWTALATHSGNIPLIEDQYISSLTAGKITSGLITAEQIILQNASGTLRSYTPTNGMSVIRSSNFIEGALGSGQGWIIKGDGTAQFDAASIRGTLSANSIFINENNRWAKNSANDASNLEFVVGNATNQLYWNPTGGTGNQSLLKVGNSTNYMQWDNNTLTVTGAITTNATIQSSTAGGLTIGTSSLQFGAGGYQSSVMFVGAHTAGGVTANKFSLGDKLYFDGTNLTITGTIFASSGTFSGTVSGATVAASTIQNTAVGVIPNFKVDTDGNVFANNIYATGSAGGTQQGLTIRSDGTGGSPASAGGSLYIFSAVGTPTTDSSQYKLRLGSSSRYLEISYPISSSRQHVNVETTVSSQHLRFSSATGQIGLLGNTQTNRTQDAVTVAGDIILENYGPDAGAGGNSGGSRTVYSKNIGASSSGTTCRIGVLDGLEYYGSPGSLRELKENIEDISGLEAINIMKSLRPRKFTWKPSDEDTELGAALKKLDIHYGFVAEEVEEAQPQLATYKITSGFQDSWPTVTDEMFNDFPLIFYKDAELPSIAISAIKNLIERIESLETQLAAQ